VDQVMGYRIAIVEDEPTIRENYADALRRQGYRVSGFGDRSAALEAFDTRLPDLVIIDITLGTEPEGGFELCRQLRARSESLPIIFLTARDNDLDAVSGLRLGADDYLTKDISLAHLTARVAALFRRLEALSRPAAEASVLERGPLRLDLDRLSVTWRGHRVDLTLTEFWMVHALARYAGHVKTRQQLMDAANVVLDDATITSHIKRIRRKFDAEDGNFDAIKTVYGVGYRWHEDPEHPAHGEESPGEQT
jgi:two-component system OmpR family response regulator